jgi:hypothetical protein
MEQPAGADVPGQDIGPAGELEVLIRLVDRNAGPERAEATRLELAHRRVDQVRLAWVVMRPTSRVDHLELEPKAERLGEAGVQLEAGRPTGLHLQDAAGGESGPVGQLPQRQVATDPLLMDGSAHERAEAERGPGGADRGRTAGRAWRHSG